MKAAASIPACAQTRSMRGWSTWPSFQRGRYDNSRHSLSRGAEGSEGAAVVSRPAGASRAPRRGGSAKTGSRPRPAGAASCPPSRASGPRPLSSWQWRPILSARPRRRQRRRSSTRRNRPRAFSPSCRSTVTILPTLGCALCLPARPPNRSRDTSVTAACSRSTACRRTKSTTIAAAWRRSSPSKGDAFGRDGYGNFDLEPRQACTVTPPRAPRMPPWWSGPSTPTNC